MKVESFRHELIHFIASECVIEQFSRVNILIQPPTKKSYLQRSNFSEATFKAWTIHQGKSCLLYKMLFCSCWVFNNPIKDKDIVPFHPLEQVPLPLLSFAVPLFVGKPPFVAASQCEQDIKKEVVSRFGGSAFTVAPVHISAFSHKQ